MRGVRVERPATPISTTLRRRPADARAPAFDEAPPIGVVELTGAADDWEARLDEAGRSGYEVVAIVERRAILGRG